MKKLTFVLLSASILGGVSSLSGLYAQVSAPGEEMAPVYFAQKTSVQDPWARSSQGPNGAAFMILKTKEEGGDRLISASSSVCSEVELHTHIQEGDVMRMRPVEDIEVKDTAVLKPGGLHVMLMDLNHPLKEGDQIPLTLVFEKGGEIHLQVPVRKKPGHSSH
jgi:hypothetical protein